ncbi:MAG: pyruvate kinase, partial [Actinomycetota bacterium]
MNRRTKIIASIGPACSDESTMKAMVEAGMDVARLNLSHGTVDEAVERLHQLRRIAEGSGRVVGIMADLPGPKVRIGELEAPIELATNAEVLLEPGDGTSTTERLFVDYESLLTDVQLGDHLAVGDGSIILEVIEHQPTALKARILFGGTTQGRPGLHIPSDRLRLTTPTRNDLKLLDVMVTEGVDMVALSFVRSAHDVRRVGLEPAPRGPLVVAK